MSICIVCKPYMNKKLRVLTVANHEYAHSLTPALYVYVTMSVKNKAVECIVSPESYCESLVTNPESFSNIASQQVSMSIANRSVSVLN